MVSKRRSGLGVSIAVMAVLAACAESCRRNEPVPPPAAAPQVSADSYVGRERCAECHAEIAAAHATTGHARTFALTKSSPVARELCGKKVPANGAYAAFEYVCDEEGLTVACPQRFGGRLFPLDMAIGSGDHAVTFLTLQVEKTGETVGVEHRMSWFASDGRIDVTPGHASLSPHVDVEFFGRVFSNKDVARCVDCHTTSAKIVGHQLTDLIAGVQCEQCHGPGKAHVAAAEQADDSLARQKISRPQSARQELELCGSCHRTADDISAERLKAYPKSVVRFQPVGLSLSKCFLNSDGVLRCTTCHDPHHPVNARTRAEQIAACNSCHDAGPEHSPCPVGPRQDCIKCHMPRQELVEGIWFHDHWIRIRRENEDPLDDSAGAADHAGDEAVRSRE